ncbi:hypothetical protein ACIP88_00190 [Streptomyces uncialis]|uniref:hypothetical protein n=1 Tax=Streptomyces uncialis TaxID=1048205 RepID=UPI003803A603
MTNLPAPTPPAPARPHNTTPAPAPVAPSAPASADATDCRARDLRTAVIVLAFTVGFLVVGAAVGLSFAVPRLAVPLQTGAAVSGAFIAATAVIRRRR